jgi:two-component system, NtrC family, nitrogen regulation response regulator NtrX
VEELKEIKSDVIRNRKILVIDDHRNIRLSLRMTLEGEGAQIQEAADVTSGLSSMGKLTNDMKFPFDCILLDIRMPDGSGLDILKQLSDFNLASRVIMISGEGTVTEAFRATQMGAFDYVEKPFGEERIIVSVARCLHFNRIKGDKQKLESRMLKGQELLGNHPKLTEIMRLIKRVAPTHGRVLINGESGTGKELVARAIHRESARSDKPLIKVNCASIPHSLIESELFGHEKGSFTGAVKQRLGVFERADQGTLFLDEIGELSIDVQAKLLRALQNGEIQRVGGEKIITVDVRLIAATNRDLSEMVVAGEFREDLFYRLNVVTFTMPPLRERQSDIKLLAQEFLKDACDENQLGERRFDKAAIAQMESYKWPGNIRELRNMVERTAILSEAETISEILDIKSDDVKKAQEFASDGKDQEGSCEFHYSAQPMPWQEFHHETGKRYLKFVLQKAGGNVSEAARVLCLERAYLHRLMKKLGVQRDVEIR